MGCFLVERHDAEINLTHMQGNEHFIKYEAEYTVECKSSGLLLTSVWRPSEARGEECLLGKKSLVFRLLIETHLESHTEESSQHWRWWWGCVGGSRSSPEDVLYSGVLPAGWTVTHPVNISHSCMTDAVCEYLSPPFTNKHNQQRALWVDDSLESPVPIMDNH